jgi:hypothetical protein
LRTISASNARLHTSVAWRIVLEHKRKDRHTSRRSLFAVSVLLLVLGQEYKIVQSMALIILNLSASSAVQLHNGSVGETLISASHVTRDKLMEIMSQGRPKQSCLSARAQRTARWKSSIQKMERSML